MGVMYSVFPLQADLCEWLEEQGVRYPSQTSRNPTLAEIKAVIASHPKWQAELSDEREGKRFSALLTEVTDAESAERISWCMVQIIALQPGPNEFYFENGDPLMILEFLCELCTATGPLVLITDTGDPPLVVHTGSSSQELFDGWGNDAG